MNKNYIPLYRKYRPQTIEEIVGQEHIKKALANAILMNRISHAYLFTGPRGTGKTSTARIFAKSLNCEKGITTTPCNECENCKNITNSIPIDVIEIDAASNRSVNDADDIIRKVALAPVRSRYKIYIIDEVHMLSNQAFNALLKTLEEPPENVVFILATTEVHKVPDTIKSRCQRFDFKRITTDDITKHLRFIADKENINITDEAISYIAQNSAGAMRDSIALLDQLSVLNSKQNAISSDDINRLLGRLSFDTLTRLFNAVILSDKPQALDVLNNIYNQGNEPVQILSNFLEYLRNALIIKSAGEGEVGNVVQLNTEQIKTLKEKAAPIEIHQIVSLTDKCAEYIRELKQTTEPKLWLDVAILDMANLAENTKLADLQKRLSMLEADDAVKPVNISAYNTPPSPVMKQEIKKTAITADKPQEAPNSELKSSHTSEKSSAADDTKAENVLNEPVPMSKPAVVNNLKALWIKFLENISSPPSRTILKQQALPVKLTEKEIIISIKSTNWLKQFAPDGSKHGLIVEAANLLFARAPEKIIVRAPETEDGAIRAQQTSDEGENDAEATPQPKKPLIVENTIAAPEEVEEAVKTLENIDKAEKGANGAENALSETPQNKSPLVAENSKEPHPYETVETEADIDTDDDNDDSQDSDISASAEQKQQDLKSDTIDTSYHTDGVNMVLEVFEGKLLE